MNENEPGKGKAEALQSFLASNGGRLHPNITIAENEASGLHWRARDGEGVQPADTIISVPHSIALSYLNALVDEEHPVLKQCRHSLRPDYEVETISFFYLILQYLHRGRSFWKPYLEALPGPEQDYTQPLFFEDSADVAGLVGTDVWHTSEQRVARYREMFDDGKAVLRKAGHDESWCTWHLFKWAAATFTSRSFSSRSVRPQDSKYWAAYRHLRDGRSQTVLIDMSHASASDFPVLFPGLDIGNHGNEAHIDYLFNPGRFDIKTNTVTAPGGEVFNNYGPKGNDELLLGYGFCIPDNPYSSVSLTLKPPSDALQQELKVVHPGYFHRPQTNTGETEWNAESTTVQIFRPKSQDSFGHLPEPLLELLIYVLQHERGIPFAFIEHPRDYVTSAEGKRYLPHVAFIMLQSLQAKLQKLGADPGEPSNAKQRQAAIYRSEQKSIITAAITPLQSYLSSLMATKSTSIPPGPCLIRLEDFVGHLERTSCLPANFIDGIEANSNTRDLEQLRLAGWEEDVWILLLSALSIADVHVAGFTGTRPPYLRVSETELSELALDADHPSHSLLEIVRNAAKALNADSIWRSPLWTLERLCLHAKRLQFDVFSIPVVNDDGEQEIRLCVYLHNKGEVTEA